MAVLRRHKAKHLKGEGRGRVKAVTNSWRGMLLIRGLANHNRF
jgi:hypothetical protein